MKKDELENWSTVWKRTGNRTASNPEARAIPSPLVERERFPAVRLYFPFFGSWFWIQALMRVSSMSIGRRHRREVRHEMHVDQTYSQAVVGRGYEARGS